MFVGCHFESARADGMGVVRVGCLSLVVRERGVGEGSTQALELYGPNPSPSSSPLLEGERRKGIERHANQGKAVGYCCCLVDLSFGRLATA